jgi:hypothetical protein
MKLTNSQSFRLPPETAEQLARLAAVWGRTKTDVLIKILAVADRRQLDMMNAQQQADYRAGRMSKQDWLRIYAKHNGIPYPRPNGGGDDGEVVLPDAPTDDELLRSLAA